MAHELVHIFTINEASSITLWFGSPDKFITVCCVGAEELAKQGITVRESIAYVIQGIVTVAWFVIGFVKLPDASKEEGK